MKEGKPTRYKGYIGSGQVNITYGYDTATNTLNGLYKNESKGRLKDTLQRYEYLSKKK